MKTQTNTNTNLVRVRVCVCDQDQSQPKTALPCFEIIAVESRGFAMISPMKAASSEILSFLLLRSFINSVLVLGVLYLSLPSFEQVEHQQTSELAARAPPNREHRVHRVSWRDQSPSIPFQSTFGSTAVALDDRAKDEDQMRKRRRKGGVPTGKASSS